MHWNLRKSESSDNIAPILSDEFQKYKNESNPLLKALFATNKGKIRSIKFINSV